MYLKGFQESVLEKLDNFLKLLKSEYLDEQDTVKFKKSKNKSIEIKEFCQKTWSKLQKSQSLPAFKNKKGETTILPYVDKFDGLENPIPNICLKVPTGGGKTLLGISAIERINQGYFSKNTGLVLWIVPTDAIYRQTIKNFKDRNHAYRKILERASAGRVKILEKTSSFSKQDIQDYLCVMLIMLQSTNRETKESLRVFKDSGHFINFFPKHNDFNSNSNLLNKIKNLDTYKDYYTLGGGKTSQIKHSLGNAIRIARPILILDEGHRAYSDLARKTVSDLNPRFVLELSATPNTKKHLSNILVNVSGAKLKEEEMIKLPINLINSDKSDWKKTICQAYEKLKSLNKDAEEYYKNSNQYIRPIMLIQVERTGKDQRDKKFIHSEDVKEYLTKTLSIHQSNIKIKTSEKNELKDESLLSKMSQVKFIITKQALQEGWDCPFAYVLVILSNTQSKKALTQLIGRILRQPYVKTTSVPSLDESYVFCYNKTVTEVVEGIKKGLQEEGMDDLIDQIKTEDSDLKKVTAKRRKPFTDLKIFLPKVLHKDGKSWRQLIYGEDILKDIDFSKISYSKKQEFTPDNFNSLEEDHIKLDMDYSEGGLELSTIETRKEKQTLEMDYAFMVKRLSNYIPNPWQASRILDEAITSLKKRNVSGEQIYLNRNYLLSSIENDIQKQIEERSEKLFKKKLSNGDICFKIFKNKIDDIKWVMGDKIDFVVSKDDKVLRKRDDSDFQLVLFDKTYQKHYNELEKKVAWYLDEQEAVKWWHRMVSKQDYHVQGWQKKKVYPDFLAFVSHGNLKQSRLSVLETKGDHLKGNDDTAYKKELFKVLEKRINHSVDVGSMETASEDEEKMVFRILIEKTWETEIKDALEV